MKRSETLRSPPPPIFFADTYLLFALHSVILRHPAYVQLSTSATKPNANNYRAF